MRHCPTRGAGNLAKALLVIMPVNFINNPVNIIWQINALTANHLIGGQQISNIIAPAR